MTLLALQTAAPFFSNDLEGFLKVVFAFLAATGAVGALVVRFATSNFNEKLKDVAGDVTQIGAKFDRLEGSVDKIEAIQARDAITLSEHAIQIVTLTRQQGEVAATLQALLKSNSDLHSDITQLIVEQGRAMTKDVQELALQVARLQERDVLAQELAALRLRAS